MTTKTTEKMDLKAEILHLVKMLEGTGNYTQEEKNVHLAKILEEVENLQ